MKWAIRVFCALVIGSTIAVAFYWQELRELRELQLYAAIYDPDRIDENFRSLYRSEPSVHVTRSDAVYELKENFRDNALPETFSGPTEDGLETRDLQTFLDDTDTTGLAILHRGQLVYERYFRGNQRDSLAIQMSVSKSMASLLAGIAIDEGAIRKIDDLVTDYAPALLGTAYEGVTVEQVLNMSSGVRWSEDYGRLDSDLVQSVIAMRLGSLDEFTKTLPRENEPGTYNRYASIDSHVLGMVIRGATGKRYEQYFQEKLWSRLGAEDDAYLLVDAVGQPLVYGGINIRLRDMLRFGELYLNNGKNWLGEQIVSQDWISASRQPDKPALTPGIDNPHSDSAFGYKYQWWIPLFPDGDDFSAIGIYGQFLYVNPSRQVVIAKTSAYRNYTVDGGMKNHETLLAMQAIARHLSPQESDMMETLVDAPSL